MQKLHVYFRIILEDIKKVSCFSIDMYKKKKKIPKKNMASPSNYAQRRDR
jgi:hypothetical protein